LVSVPPICGTFRSHLFFLFKVPVIRPRSFSLAFALLVGASIGGACSVDNADMQAPSCSGLNCSEPGPPMNAQDVPSSLTGAPDASALPPSSPAKEACGIGSCLPDDTAECVPPAEPGSSSGDAGVERDAGTDPSLDAGGADASAEGPSIDGSFSQPEPAPSGPPRYACQLGYDERGSVSRVCGAAGSQQKEQACTSSLDCAPGLGCVGPAGSGRCLPYCCAEGADTCEQGFYCAERPLRSEALGEADGPLVPVCDRAENCSLGEQENCTGPSCLCGPEMACQLVRPDGTTACVMLRDHRGQAGDGCPCDRGYHCSQATEPAVCVKTCDLDEADSDTCGVGVCQSTPALPVGWGICVGASPDQMTP
jgi:hypothetical protein